MKNTDKNFKDLQNLLKEHGFIFNGSEIYGGLANTYDYGPLGTMVINNLKNAWWVEFLQREPANYPLDAKIILNPRVWDASGHTKNFSDLLVENYVNNKRYRADHVLEAVDPKLRPAQMSASEIENYLQKNVRYYDASETKWGPVRPFQLMFETHQGIVEGAKTALFLRPELAQGIFINFNNVQRALGAKLPFGIGQIGRSFRNEVTPGNYIFRTREFEQMELEYFVAPNEAAKAYRYYVKKAHKFVKGLGLRDESLRLKVHAKAELAHYSRGTTDIEFLYPFGWGELLGIANRGDFDLTAHSNASGARLAYHDGASNTFITPYVIEPSMGVDRLLLALLVDAYHVEGEGAEARTVLKLSPRLAPYQFAILPLSKKAHGEVAYKLYLKLKKQGLRVTYDAQDSIGKRYRYQDAIGTPYALTITDDTAKLKTLTLRERDTTAQVTITLGQIKKYAVKD